MFSPLQWDSALFVLNDISYTPTDVSPESKVFKQLKHIVKCTSSTGFSTLEREGRKRTQDSTRCLFIDIGGQ